MSLDTEAREALGHLIDERRTAAGTCLPGSRTFPIGRTEGCFVFDEYGFPHLDCGPGGAANALGHNHPLVQARLQEHLMHYTYPGEDMLSRFAVEYAHELASRFDGDKHVLVVSSVAEARTVVRMLLHEHGSLHVVDETKTGFGRTGKLWAFQHNAIAPDVIVLGPAGGGGLPFAAVVAPAGALTAEMIPPMSAHPLVCAAALVVLEGLTKELLDNVVAAGRAFEDGFRQLHGQFPELIGPAHPKSVGLTQHLPITDKVDAKKFRYVAQYKGLLMHPDLALTPPLTITEQEVRQAIDVVADVLLDWS